MSGLERIPNIIRWVGVLPTAMLSAIIVNLLIVTVGWLYSFFDVVSLGMAEWVFGPLAASAVWVYFGTGVAPKFKKHVSVILAAMYLIPAIGVTLSIIIGSGVEASIMKVIISNIAHLFGSIFAIKNIFAAENSLTLK